MSMPETFLLFAFVDAGAAHLALEQIRRWVKAFRITHGQLAARHDPRDIVVYVRLKFEAHEANAYRRWLERIPREQPFDQAELKTVAEDAAGFADVQEIFALLPEAD